MRLPVHSSVPLRSYEYAPAGGVVEPPDDRRVPVVHGRVPVRLRAERLAAVRVAVVVQVAGEAHVVRRDGEPLGAVGASVAGLQVLIETIMVNGTMLEQ